MTACNRVKTFVTLFGVFDAAKADVGHSGERVTATAAAGHVAGAETETAKE